MKKYLKMVTINGKECYVEVKEDEAYEAYKNGEAIMMIDENGKSSVAQLKTVIDEEDYDDEDEEDEDDEEDDEKHGNSKSKAKTKIFTTEFKGKISDFFSGIKTQVDDSVKSASDFFRGQTKKTSRFIKVLPFMDDEDIHDAVEKLLSGDENFKNVNVIAMMPFLSNEDCDRVFMKAIQDGNMRIEPTAAAPFVSQECLSIVVDKYTKGEYPNLNVDKLYPFLSGKDVKKLFNYIIESKE